MSAPTSDPFSCASGSILIKFRATGSRRIDLSQQTTASGLARSVLSNKPQHNTRSTQRGAYAVEFGLVFLTFFLVIYAILTYGMIFAAQQSLNAAAEQGARAMLSWEADNGERKLAAEGKAKLLTQWITDSAGGALNILPPCYDGQTEDAASSCDKGQARLVIRYDYGASPLVPTLTSLLVPDHLSAEATVDLGVVMQESPAGGS
jgi:hypothetical protein